jgi:hypothetical protein
VYYRVLAGDPDALHRYDWLMRTLVGVLAAWARPPRLNAASGNSSNRRPALEKFSYHAVDRPRPPPTPRVRHGPGRHAPGRVRGVTPNLVPPDEGPPSLDIVSVLMRSEKG